MSRPTLEAQLNDLQDLWDARVQALRPPPRLTVSKWADQYRMLPETSAEPGRWRTDRTPFLKAIMDALSPAHPAEWVVLMKGGQCGGTEVGNNWLGYTIHLDPAAMLLVQPTEQMVKANAYERINPLIESTPEIRERMAKARSRDKSSSIFRKDFRGGFLRATASVSPIGLRSSPVPRLFLDEVDAYPADAGGEGEPVDLAEKRTATFGGRAKKYMVSTPTIKERSRIGRRYRGSNQQRFFLQCQGCGEWDYIRWAQIQWPEGQPEKAAYVCAACGHRHQEQEKTALLAGGEWRATVKEWDGVTWGFHLPSMYSPFETWAKQAQQFLKAKKAGPTELKVFVNTVLGEEWEEPGEAPEWQILHGRREPYEIGTIPVKEVLLLTAGVDVQMDRLEVEIVGWGEDKQSWSIDYRVLMADKGKTADLDDPVWQVLSELLNETWAHPSGAPMPLRALAIDEGFNTQIVRDWGRRQSARQVLVVKGFDHATVPLGRPKKQDVNSRGRLITRGVQVWPAGVSLLKGEFYGWLWLEPPSEEARKHGTKYPAGYCHFPEYSEEHFKQVTAEQIRTRESKGFSIREWYKVYERNEGLDCRIYARAAAYFCGMDFWKPAQWKQLKERLQVETETGNAAPRTEKRDPGPRRPKRRTRRSSYMNR